MYARAREQIQKWERDAISPGSSGPTYRNIGTLASGQIPTVVAPTTNPEISLDKTGAPNNTIDAGSLEGNRREAVATTGAQRGPLER